jgi:cyclic-di-AMP phosphodiesterase PgpH
LSISIETALPIQFLILLPIASMLIAIIFDSRLAFYFTVTNALLTAAIRGNDYSIIIAMILAGTLALFTVRDIKSRTQIYRSITYIFIGFAFAVLIEAVQRSSSFSIIIIELGFGLINAVLSAFLTFGLLLVLERFFGITTDLRLLDLLNLQHPLLRQLETAAPGTYHHSISLGTLAGTAAQAIGANSTLATVGAYYHDIGKIPNPKTFIENQTSTENIHDSLDPKDSASRIIQHVQQGLLLAREHHLPPKVIEFIYSHHGTTLVSYFYQKEKVANPDDQSLASRFVYPGPKPVSKEAGILMLADVIEAATRTLEDPTTEKIQKLIDTLAQRRLSEGQLDDCELTLKELYEVKKSFLASLSGIHHVRIKYPTKEEADAAQRMATRTAKLLSLPSTEDILKERLKKSEPL